MFPALKDKNYTIHTQMQVNLYFNLESSRKLREKKEGKIVIQILFQYKIKKYFEMLKHLKTEYKLLSLFFFFLECDTICEFFVLYTQVLLVIVQQPGGTQHSNCN